MKKMRSILAAVVGTILEFYDLMLFTHFLFILAPIFFPNKDPFVTSLLGMGSFASGLLMRPIGGIVFGHFGDKLGRRSALAASILLISAPTFIIGILPTYAQIGIFAPLILTLCRIVQSFSAGGELTGASVFLIEYANEKYKNTMSSFFSVSILIGSLIGASLGLISLYSFLPEWGWRIPFIMGGVLGVMSYFFRKQIQETPSFSKILKEKTVSKFPIKDVIKRDKIGVLRAMGICAGITSPFNIIFIYLSEVLKNKLNIGLNQILIHNMKIMLIMILFLPIAGLLADRFGNKKIMGLSLIGSILVSYPLFLAIERASNILDIFPMLTLLAIFWCGAAAPSCAIVTTFFPTNERYSGYGLGWSLGTFLFSGLSPLFSLLLSHWTGDIKAPFLVLMSCSMLAILALQKAKK